MINKLIRFKHYEGYKLVDEIAWIEEDAARYDLTVNILDEVLKANIDVNPNRLNVHVDKNSVIKKFTIG